MNQIIEQQKYLLKNVLAVKLKRWYGMSKQKIPNPGSPAAIELGCTCAVLDNCRGADWFGKVHGFWVTENCPIHGDKK